MKVTVLIENTLDKDILMNQNNNNFPNMYYDKLQCEHGLSLFIEYKDKKILLDAGATETFYENTGIMGISLKEVDMAVLSHGHYDHSGGFGALFRKNETITVYAQSGIVCKYYSGSGGIHEIGVPEEILKYSERFQLMDGICEPFRDVYLIPHNTEGLSLIGEKTKLYKQSSDESVGIIPDDFSHEQSLVFDTEQGLVIFNSCSHGGVANIIAEVKAVCGEKSVYAYVGGLHMKGKRHGEEICTFSDMELDALCDVIQKEGIQHIYTGHCTGKPGLQEMKKRLGDRLQILTTGLQFEL